MRKAVRRIFIGAAFVAGLLLLAVPFNSMRQTAALKRYEKKLRKAGEKLDYRDLMPPKLATNENGAPALLAAIDRLNQSSTLNGLGRVMGFVAPGKAMSLCSQPEVVSLVQSDSNAMSNAVPIPSPFGSDSYKQVTNSWETVLFELEQNREALRGIEDALKARAFDFGFNYGPLHFLESQKYLSNIKSGALWYQAAALIEMHRGNRLAAIECVRKIIMLSDVLKDKNTGISFLVRIAIIRIGLTATWEILQMPDWSESELGQLQAVWETTDCSKDLVQYLEMDRALYISTFNALFDNDQSVRKVVFASDVTIIWRSLLQSTLWATYGWGCGGSRTNFVISSILKTLLILRDGASPIILLSIGLPVLKSLRAGQNQAHLSTI